MLVEQVSSTKMVFNQFESSSVVMWSFRIMILLSQRRQLVIQSMEVVEEEQVSDGVAGLSQTYQSKIQKFKSFGWIMRFTESRDARLRVLTWVLHLTVTSIGASFSMRQVNLFPANMSWGS